MATITRSTGSRFDFLFSFPFSVSRARHRDAPVTENEKSESARDLDGGRSSLPKEISEA
jgi:hypothetical protein